jgi:hypothetical protein
MTSRPQLALPQGFRPCSKEEILFAEIGGLSPPNFAPRLRSRGAKAAGLRYDRRAESHFVATCPGFVGHPWIRFATRNASLRWAQPDGLFIDFRIGRITILEFKLKHTTDAWWQLRRLYEPLLRFIFGESLWHYACCEVVRWYDPSIRVPEQVTFIDDPRRLFANAYGIHIFDGGGEKLTPLPRGETSQIHLGAQSRR